MALDPFGADTSGGTWARIEDVFGPPDISRPDRNAREHRRDIACTWELQFLAIQKRGVDQALDSTG
jgi:hypothetical protein